MADPPLPMTNPLPLPNLNEEDNNILEVGLFCQTEHLVDMALRRYVLPKTRPKPLPFSHTPATRILSVSQYRNLAFKLTIKCINRIRSFPGALVFEKGRPQVTPIARTVIREIASTELG